jgi:hypothetical protein
MVRFSVATECAHRSKDALNGVGEEKLEEELMGKVSVILAASLQVWY